MAGEDCGKIVLCSDGRLSLVLGEVELCCNCTPIYDNCTEFSQTLDGGYVSVSFNRSFFSPPDHLVGDHAKYIPLTVDMSTIKNPPHAMEYTTSTFGSNIWSRVAAFEYTVNHIGTNYDLSLQQIVRDYGSPGLSRILLPYSSFRIECSKFGSSSPWSQTVSYQILWKSWQYPTIDGDPDLTTQTGVDYLRDTATEVGGGDQSYTWRLQRTGAPDFTVKPSNLLLAYQPNPPNSWDDVTVSISFQ